MFQALPALPRKQDNEFNQPLISGAISSPEDMEIAGFFRVSFVCCLLEIGLFWVVFFFFLCVFLCCSCLGSRSLAGI